MFNEKQISYRIVCKFGIAINIYEHILFLNPRNWYPRKKWIHSILFNNFQESTGTSLYVLYKALKFQVKKGPVDAVTGDAMYSLSEDRLLKTENILEHVTIVSNEVPVLYIFAIVIIKRIWRLNDVFMLLYTFFL